MRWVRATVAAVALPLALSSGVALGEDRIAFLAEQLRTSDDARVRTQAALALGASGDEAAVSPLCGALGADANTTVKVAAAAALGKLGKPSALPCLKAAQAKESTASVKAQIDKAIAGLSQGGGSSGPAGPPAPSADAKFYVAISVTNKTKRPAADIDGLVRTAMQDKILAKRGFAVAPKNETPREGDQIVKAKNLKGFLLLATVEAPVYSGGVLTQVVRVSMWSYPEKVLQAEVAPKFTQSGTSGEDVEGESILIKTCAEKAVESFQKIVGVL
jgi:hypothetical protein